MIDPWPPEAVDGADGSSDDDDDEDIAAGGSVERETAAAEDEVEERETASDEEDEVVCCCCCCCCCCCFIAMVLVSLVVLFPLLGLGFLFPYLCCARLLSLILYSFCFLPFSNVLAAACGREGEGVEDGSQ